MSAILNTAELPSATTCNENAMIPFQDHCLPTVSDVYTKLTEFSNSFNSLYRVSLLNCTRSERQSLIYTMISLKKNLKCALSELGKSLKNRQYRFSCGICDEDIIISPNEDMWSSLQNHEHFEELYYQFLNNRLEIKPLTDEPVQPTLSESESNVVTEDTITGGDSNTDSGIEQQEMEQSTSGLPKLNPISAREGNPSEENVNSFRFNFDINYDEQVESKIYPSNIMSQVRKYDTVKEFTIMKIGQSKAACLICHCEINGMKISKYTLLSHAMGQKHLKAAADAYNLQLLQFYHEFWLKQEAPIQAHQVYFRIYEIPTTMQCVMCGPIIDIKDIIAHIMGSIHKKRVLEMYEKRINLYLLVNLQVQAYGLTQEEVDARENECRLREEEADKLKKRKREGKNSDSDTADETKKLAARSEGIKHNIIKAIERPESANPFDQLPNRMKDDIEFLKVMVRFEGLSVWCDLCKCELPGNADYMKRHIILSSEHLIHKKGNYTYFCDICNSRVNNEQSWMNHNYAGPRHLNMAASRKDRVTEYECSTCKMVIFGDEFSLTRHMSVGNRRNRKERGTKLPDIVKKFLRSREHILTQSALLAEDAEQVLTNSLTENCCEKLELALSEIFDSCRVYPFGSRISGIGNKDSDLDVFVDIGGTYHGEINQEPSHQVAVIRKASKAFGKSKEYAGIVTVLTARTPILKLHHIPTKLDCDLSFKHGLSVENTRFLRFCIELQPMCQQLILLVKKWAEYFMFESITTYALAILCIFYLQVTGYLLSVEKLRDLNSVETQSINGWKTINYVLSVNETKPHVKVYQNTIFELLQEFFKYYSKFDFNSYVVCPLLGQLVKRSLFSEGSPEDLPPEMEAYVAQLEGDDPELFRCNSFMCIQDPFDLSHNLTKAAQQGTLTKFQTMCKLSLLHTETLK